MAAEKTPLLHITREMPMENNANLPLHPEDEHLILRHKEILATRVIIKLAYNDSEAGQLMADFCAALEKLLPNVAVKTAPADEDPPCIHVWDNLHFMMVPKGDYLEMFLLSLIGNDALASQELGMDAAQVRTRVSLPVLLKMYVMDNCPFCKITVPKGLFLAGASPLNIDIRIIDAAMFPDLAAQDNVRSVPATIMDDLFRWNGDFQITEVVDMIAARNPAELGYNTLKKIISDGDAEAVADLMNDFNTVIPAFTDLLVAEKWPERLGAMVAFEYLSEKNPALAETILDMLWAGFDLLDAPIMGDVLHLVGVLNRESQAKQVQKILAGEYPPSVKTVAREIFEAICRP